MYSANNTAEGKDQALPCTSLPQAAVVSLAETGELQVCQWYNLQKQNMFQFIFTRMIITHLRLPPPPSPAISGPLVLLWLCGWQDIKIQSLTFSLSLSVSRCCQCLLCFVVVCIIQLVNNISIKYIKTRCVPKINATLFLYCKPPRIFVSFFSSASDTCQDWFRQNLYVRTCTFYDCKTLEVKWPWLFLSEIHQLESCPGTWRDCHKPRVTGLSYNWWEFQAWDTLQDSTDNSSTDKVATSLEWQEYFSQFQDTTDVLPCQIHLPVCLWFMDPQSRTPKTTTSHGNEVLPQDTTQLLQRPCYQRGSPCQIPAGNRTTRRPPDRRRETQTAVVWSWLPFISPSHLSLNREGRWGTTDDFATSFPHFSLFSTALWDLANSRPDWSINTRHKCIRKSLAW